MHRAEFAEIMIATEIRQQSQAMPKTLEVYWEELQDWDVEDFKIAMDKACSEIPFGFPKLSDIVENRPPKKGTTETQERAFWDALSDRDERDPNAELDQSIGVPEDILRGPRIRCVACQDTGVIVVYHPICYDLVRASRLEIKHLRTCAVACRECENGAAFQNVRHRPMIPFNALTMKEVTEISMQGQVDELSKFVNETVDGSIQSGAYDWQP